MNRFLSNNEVHALECQGVYLDYDRRIELDGRKAWIVTISWIASGVWLGLEYASEGEP